MDRSDLLMKAIKAVHSSISTSDATRTEELNKQRHSQETFAKLVTPAVGISYTTDYVQGEESLIPIEWAIPEFAHRTDKIIMYCHGGGYTCGGLGYSGILAGKLAMHTGLEVICFEYRLAPENPYPAAINDAMTIWNHLMMLGYGARDILVAGDSAGGNMAIELALGLKEAGRMLPGALILMSPWTDMTATLPSYEKYKDADPMLTMDYILGVRHAYTAGKLEYNDPRLSPLYADLQGLPPTLIQVGSNEILRSDSEEFHKKLKKCGVYSKLEVSSGGWHVYQQLPIPRASKALDQIKTFIDEII